MKTELGSNGMTNRKSELIKRINFWRIQNKEKVLNVFILNKFPERCLEEVWRFQYTLFLIRNDNYAGN